MEKIENFDKKIAQFGRYGAQDITVYGFAAFAGDVIRKVPKIMTKNEEENRLKRYKSLIDQRTRSVIGGLTEYQKKKKPAGTLQHKVQNTFYTKEKSLGAHGASIQEQDADDMEQILE